MADRVGHLRGLPQLGIAGAEYNFEIFVVQVESLLALIWVDLLASVLGDASSEPRMESGRVANSIFIDTRRPLRPFGPND